ncbi:transposase [Vibrio harveyi]
MKTNFAAHYSCISRRAKDVDVSFKAKMGLVCLKLAVLGEYQFK